MAVPGAARLPGRRKEFAGHARAASGRRPQCRAGTAQLEQDLGVRAATTSLDSPQVGCRSSCATPARAGHQSLPEQRPGAPRSDDASKWAASHAARFGCSPADFLRFISAAALCTAPLVASASPRLGREDYSVFDASAQRRYNNIT
ncbi:hypothetical protein NDU88_003336 [Pleurodeles waltl]|uniref:Uncharacterized protein n=1 Tax=Pleurodeles waltl TaxID=8319 RepID=A0AAV7PAY5_PLEWA|nr:hypothetical protein NDU88_003336 [Pleurodeles waltl]